MVGNASRGGLFLKMTQPLAMGAQVEITLLLPNGLELRLVGEVVHVRAAADATPQQPAGVGVRFAKEHRADLLLLESMAASEARQPPSASELAASQAEEVAPVERDASVQWDEAAADGATVRSQSAVAPDGVPMSEPAVRVRLDRPDGPVADVLGIDFGTSFSAVSVCIGDRVVLLSDETGTSQFPSVVGYPQAGEIVVGAAARRRLISDARRTIASAKRLLGRRYDDPHVAGLLHGAAYETLRGPDGSIVVRIDGEDIAVPQICAEVFRHLRELAERRTGASFERTVLTMPVAFGAAQEALRRRAAELAGLEVVEIVPEPVAAALSYGFGRGKNEIAAVYDFGGGTFDFSVVDFSYDSYRVLATAGDAWLGGDDFDLALARSLANQFWHDHGIELQQRVVEWIRLLQACEAAKRTLSRREIARVRVEEIALAPTPIDLEYVVTRERFEEMCAGLVDSSLELCGQALARVGLVPRDATEIIATGGTSSIPLIQRRVAELFEKTPPTAGEPTEAVVRGAGICAARIANGANPSELVIW